MSEPDDRYLSVFPAWLLGLSDDARALLGALEASELPGPSRRLLAGVLNYLFKSLDLIPDGVEDLGFLEDAFVFRVGARLALPMAHEDSPDEDGSEPDDLGRLAQEAELVSSFLGETYDRLEAHVLGLEHSSARGRSVDQILADDEALAQFAREIRAWADGYVAPTFARDPKSLVKLRSFLTTKWAG